MRDELVKAMAVEWRPVIGWPAYEVSRDGNIRKASGEPVGQWMSDQGYMLARLSKPRAMVRVHRLVAAAFVTNPDNLPHVNHINNDRADNRAGNLEWCTQAQNLAHADKQGRMQRDYWTGVRSPNARLCDDQVRALRERYAAGGIGLESLGALFGISKRAAQRCVNRETYGDVQ